MFTDTHCHLFENDETNKNLIYDTAINDGVSLMVDIGYNMQSSITASEYCKDKKGLYFACGIHPDSCDETTDENLKVLKELSKSEKCVAIGEIGLDYHFEPFDKNKQQDAFIKQLILANEVNLPISIHSRDCTFDMVEILKANKSLLNNGGIMHCYSGSKETAKILLDLGLNISFSGVLTFKNASNLVEVCSYCPFDKILSETDSPYLAPVPMRGKVNEPKFVKFVTSKIAEIKGESISKTAEIIRENTLKLFTKIK